MLRLDDDDDSCESLQELEDFLYDSQIHGVDPFDFEFEVDPEPEMSGHEAGRQESEDILRDC